MSSTNDDAHERRMQRALALAARGRTSPNPQVGAVVVSRGEIVGEGYHRHCGGPHAEIHALADAGARAKGADLYVTLEPCNHVGRTPPCTRAILESGLKRVFIGHGDPDPHVAGGGARYLAERGVEVSSGIAPKACTRFYEAYDVHRTQGRPHVTLKAGMTLDGRVATRTKHSRWITGPEARRAGHRMRQRLDAILVGIGTVLADDPQLTTRLPRGQQHDPVRVIVDSRARTPSDAKVIAHESDSPTIIAHTAAGSQAANRLEREGVECLRCRSQKGRVDLSDLMSKLAERGIVSLLAEGGGEIHWSLLNNGLVDRVMLFVAPVIVGGREAIPVVGGEGVERMPEAFGIESLRVRRVGQDLLLEGAVGPRKGAR